MNKFNHEDWDIEPQVDTGHDEFVYGNYVEWDEFRQDEEENLLSSFDVHLPWGKELHLSEYIEFLNQEVFENTSIIEDWDLNKLKVLTQGSNISKIIIQFPNRNDNNSNEVVSAIFDYYEVPSGVEYEYELPEKLQYWHTMLEDDYFENEYEYYKKYPLKFRTYEQTILDIQSKVSNSSETLTKKSLLLSSFIISESLLKSAIVSKIPEETTISEFSKNILSTEIDNRIRGSVDKRNRLFKQLFTKKAPRQEWVNLRNSLAHDIESSTIQGNEITYTSLNDGLEYTLSFDDLFEQQITFYEELQQIIDTNEEPTK